MKLAFLGDIALIGKYDLTNNSLVKKRLYTLSKKLQDYDYVVANLETPLTDKTTSWIPKSMHLRSPLLNVELLKYLNINAVSLANNHIYDYGKKGLMDTILCLENNGIEWFGANSKFLVKSLHKNNICFSGFCCYSTNGAGYIEKKNTSGINTLSWENVKTQIEKDKNNELLSIFSFHWGREHTNYPNYEHILLSKKLASIGDIVIHGHHPHIIQGIQKINNSIVAYSQGNCLFDDCTSINGRFSVKQNTNNKTSFILEVTVEENIIVNYDVAGFKDEEHGIVFYNARPFINHISELLQQVNDVRGYNETRQSQIDTAILDKFGKHDLKWLINRLNYYSIGAKIAAKVRNYKYRREILKYV